MNVNELAKNLGDACYLFLTINFLWGLYCVIVGWRRVVRLYAQLVAYQARMYEYGAYLDEFAKNPKIAPRTRAPNLTHVQWDIRTRQKIITGEKVQPYIDRATAMFKEVIANHPSTPWAARAEYELQRGFGVELIPDYDGPHPTPSGPLIPVPNL